MNIEQLHQIITQLQAFLQNSYPESAGGNQSLFEHVKNMLNAYHSFKKQLLINIPEFQNKNGEIFADFLFEIMIIFHDIGKLNFFFQGKVLFSNSRIERPNIPKIYSYHSFQSSIVAYWLIENICLEKDMCSSLISKKDIQKFSWMIINAILLHHSYNFQRFDYLSSFQDSISSFRLYPEYLEAFKIFLTYLSKSSFLDKIKSLNISALILEKLDSLKNWISKLINEDGNNLIQKEISKFNKSLSALINSNQIPEYIFHLISYFASILFDLDEWDSSMNRGIQDPNSSILFDRYRSKTNPELIDIYIRKIRSDDAINAIRMQFLNDVRSQVLHYDLKSPKIITLTAPTGAGKTIALLDTAIFIKNKFFDSYGFYPKIIYALPFVSICDQVEELLQKLLNTLSQTDLLTVHHYLVDLEREFLHTPSLSSKINQSENNILQDDDELPHEHFLSKHEINLWQSDFIVTTTIKLFDTLFRFKKRNLKRFHRLCNSIIIIDEYHTIPIQYHKLVKKAMEILEKYFNITFILATATTPALFSNREVFELAKPSLFTGINRYQIQIPPDLKQIPFLTFQERILSIIQQNLNKNIMIIVNTKKNARELYRFLETKCQEVLNSNEKSEVLYNLQPANLFHLSTNLIPIHRKVILNKDIIPRLKSQYQSPDLHNINAKKQRIVLVTTQLIEAGIDISFDLIVREMAPFSSIIQSAGRCNRHNISIQEEKALPSIFIAFISDSYQIYHNIDIDVSKKFLIQLYDEAHNENNNVISERFIRNKFLNYATEIVNHRNTNLLFTEFINCRYDELTSKFNLLNNEDRQEYPLIIIPNEDNENVKQIREICANIQYYRKIPTILFNYSTNISLSRIKDLDPQLLLKVENTNLLFFVLDLSKISSSISVDSIYHPKLGFMN